MITLNVNSLVNAEIFWKELGLEDEVALNETVVSDPQTVTICLPYLDEVFDKIVELGMNYSEILPLIDGRFMFSFVAPEDNTVIIIGTWVAEPYSGQKRAEFFHNIEHVTVVNTYQKLSELTAGDLILFGRVTCPWTRYFARQLPALKGANIYYVDTENTDINPEFAAVRETYAVSIVPTLIKIEADGKFVSFDEKTNSLSGFVK